MIKHVSLDHERSRSIGSVSKNFGVVFSARNSCFGKLNSELHTLHTALFQHFDSGHHLGILWLLAHGKLQSVSSCLTRAACWKRPGSGQFLPKFLVVSTFKNQAMSSTFFASNVEQNHRKCWVMRSWINIKSWPHTAINRRESPAHHMRHYESNHAVIKKRSSRSIHRLESQNTWEHLE